MNIILLLQPGVFKTKYTNLIILKSLTNNLFEEKDFIFNKPCLIVSTFYLVRLVFIPMGCLIDLTLALRKTLSQ